MPPEIQRRGVTTLGPRTRNFAKRLRRRHGDDERGAELIEFAFVVVLLITLLYGIITYGVILAAQATVTQAAADAARAGIVQGTIRRRAVTAAKTGSRFSRRVRRGGASLHRPGLDEQGRLHRDRRYHPSIDQ